MFGQGGWGGVSAPIWGWVCSNFSGGGLLQISKFSGGGGVYNFRNTVNVRPVRILLECILVTVHITIPFFLLFPFSGQLKLSFHLFLTVFIA